MKYQAQVRTILYSGAWSQWVNVGDPMSQEEAKEWFDLQTKVATTGLVEFQVLVTAVEYGVFKV
jgi:hypothetical protein